MCRASIDGCTPCTTGCRTSLRYWVSCLYTRRSTLWIVCRFPFVNACAPSVVRKWPRRLPGRAFCLPAGASIFADKGYISAPDAKSLLDETGVRLVTPKRKNMAPNDWADDFDIAHYRKRIESVYSQLEAMACNVCVRAPISVLS